MPPKFHSARAYVAFDEAIRSVETWLHPRAPRCGASDGDEVARRLVQRIVEIGLHEFILMCVRRLERGLEPLPDPGSSYSCGGLVIDSARGRTRVRPALILRSFAVFLGHWSHALVVHVAALFKRRALARGRATLAYGVGSADLTHGGSDRNFLAFCREGPIVPLRDAHRYIVQALRAIASTNAKSCTYHRVPLFALALENPMGVGEFLTFLTRHAKALPDFVRAVWRLPVICLLGRDFAYHAAASRLNARGLIENVIITNSNYSAQPLWMRRYAGRSYATHMVWYSQNCIPFVYAFDPISTPLPNHRHLAFDETWVWTEGYASYIRKLEIPAVIHVVGPILWYLPQPRSARPGADQIRIVVFDVTPVRPEVAQRIGLAYNYYSTENVLAFIGDIVAAARAAQSQLGRKVGVFLKHKRTHEPARDPRYIAGIERLVQSEAALTLELPEANVFSLCAGADLVIAVPYSSPVYVAMFCGVKAMYYDPSSELVSTHDAAQDIPFAAGRAELEGKLLQLLGGNARQCREALEPNYPRTA